MKITRMEPPRRLVTGERCWFLHGTLLYEVDIAEVRVCLEEGEPHEFAMYRVRSVERCDWMNDATQHRSDLFAKPSERLQLLARIEGDMEALEYLKNTIEEEAEDAEAL